jgi:hypothetical protein
MSGIMLNFAGVTATSVPSAPTIGTATATSATTATVSYTAPANDGGSVITSYTATSSPSGITGTLSQAGSGTITVSGLSGSTSYTFTVTATNAIGTSAASSASNSITTQALIPTVIGEAFGGGYYAGQIGNSSVATHYLIVAPLSSGQTQNQWKNAQTTATGADSDIDGEQNTLDMVSTGSSTVYPCAHFCNNLSTGGQTDWYMPAKNELEVCYYNLKPTTLTNSTSSGSNPNSIPSRGNYTSGTPAQTSVTIFKTGNSEAFNSAQYWSSTESTTTTAKSQHFNFSGQYNYSKDNSARVRAIRRVAV